MSTTMVITTVVTADIEIEVDVEKVKQYAFDHVRNQEQTLVQQLTDNGVDAQVTTALLDVNQLLDYIRLRQEAERRRKGMQTETNDRERADAALDFAEIDVEAMSEWEFVEYTLQQLAAGERQATVLLSDEALAAIEDEAIGEDFSRSPFLY